jgi:hypothetical protein
MTISGLNLYNTRTGSVDYLRCSRFISGSEFSTIGSSYFTKKVNVKTESFFETILTLYFIVNEDIDVKRDCATRRPTLQSIPYNRYEELYNRMHANEGYTVPDGTLDIATTI